MTDQWSTKETTSHQDHVIAHVIGASVLGYFVHDEAVHLFLDMGFVWTVYLDGQMVLLPQGMAVGELEVDSSIKAELNREVEKLQRERDAAPNLQYITAVTGEVEISEVSFSASDDRRRLILSGDHMSLTIETSISTAAIKVTAG